LKFVWEWTTPITNVLFECSGNPRAGRRHRRRKPYNSNEIAVPPVVIGRAVIAGNLARACLPQTRHRAARRMDGGAVPRKKTRNLSRRNHSPRKMAMRDMLAASHPFDAIRLVQIIGPNGLKLSRISSRNRRDASAPLCRMLSVKGARVSIHNAAMCRNNPAHKQALFAFVVSSLSPYRAVCGYASVPVCHQSAFGRFVPRRRAAQPRNLASPD
jgi:hypothetical protein